MFDQNPPAFLREMNPIMFVLHIPYSIQEFGHHFVEKNKSRIEDFFVVYNGLFVIIATVCPLNEFSHGVYDVRSRIISILKPSIPIIETIAPFLTSGGIIYAKNIESVPKSVSRGFVLKESDLTIRGKSP